MPSFHETSFPLSIALGASGGPERRTDVVTLASGQEVRNSRWADSRRRYDLGTAIRTLDDLHSVIAFFEERRGRLYGFRFRDRSDDRSCAAGASISAADQVIGVGDGARQTFQLVKTYGGTHAPYVRTIDKPVAGSVIVAVNGTTLEGGAFSVDTTTGLVTLTSAPTNGLVVSAGYLFDVPVRFDSDSITVDLGHFNAGSIPQIPLIEVRP